MLDERNTKNHKDVCALAYHGKKKRHNWQAYVLCHKKCHDVQTDLVEQDFNDFTERENVTFLIYRIMCDTLDSVIYIVLGGATRAYFEGSKMMLDEHIRMVMERINFSSRNVSATYAASGNQPGRGDYGKVALVAVATVPERSMVNGIIELFPMVTMNLWSII